jgi:hypothetical protein
MEMIDVLKKLSEIAETKPELVKDAVANVKATNPQAVVQNAVQSEPPMKTQEGGMSDVHIGAEEAIGEFVDEDGNLTMPKRDVVKALVDKSKKVPFPTSYEYETAAKMVADKFDDDGSARDEYEPDPEDNIPHDVDTQMNMDAPAEEPKIEADYPSTLNINGMTTEEDVISMIQDTIDSGKGDDAKDYLEQFKQHLFVKSGGQAESEQVNTNTMKTEDKKPVNEAIQISTDSPEEAGMMMQILKLAGVKPVDDAMIGAEEPNADADADAEASPEHGDEGHDHSDCPVCGDDAIGSNDMAKMRDMITAPDEEKAEETFANEPEEKVQDTDTLVNVHSGGLNKKKVAMPKAQDGDNALKAFEDTVTEEDLANSLRTQYEGFKESYKKAAEVAEAKAKPDFLDMDKDGNKKEPMKKAVKDKEAK